MMKYEFLFSFISLCYFSISFFFLPIHAFSPLLHRKCAREKALYTIITQCSTNGEKKNDNDI